MKKLLLGLLALTSVTLMTGCMKEDTISSDQENQKEVQDGLETNQPTPTDITYSLERYNLIKRAYWVNGQRDKAAMVPSPVVDLPLGYIILFTNNMIVGSFSVEGKVSSLNSYLTPDCYWDWNSGSNGSGGNYCVHLADTDGSYGENDAGIFFFTPESEYFEWNGTYLYSDVSFEVETELPSGGRK